MLETSWRRVGIISFKWLAKNDRLPPVPVDTTVVAHWLAMEGVQPKIPDNPPDLEATSTLSTTGTGSQGRANMCSSELLADVDLFVAVKHKKGVNQKCVFKYI